MRGHLRRGCVTAALRHTCWLRMHHNGHRLQLDASRSLVEEGGLLLALQGPLGPAFRTAAKLQDDPSLPGCWHVDHEPRHTKCIAARRCTEALLAPEQVMNGPVLPDQFVWRSRACQLREHSVLAPVACQQCIHFMLCNPVACTLGLPAATLHDASLKTGH